MSTTDTTPTTDDDLGRIDENQDIIFNKLSQLNERVDTLESELESERARNQRLEERLADVEGRTDLLRMIENSDEMTGKQRSVTLLQHLQKAAQQGESSDDPTSAKKASVTREQAEIALQHPDVDRTTIYTDMQRAARLVGDEDICWYDSGNGGSQLFLDLGAGSLPAEFGGGE